MSTRRRLYPGTQKRQLFSAIFLFQNFKNQAKDQAKPEKPSFAKKPSQAKDQAKPHLPMSDIGCEKDMTNIFFPTELLLKNVYYPYSACSDPTDVV